MKKLFFFFITLIVLFSFQCAYFNTFYNAKVYYKKAYRIIEKSNSDSPTQAASAQFQKAIDKALILLKEYPDSKYVNDARLLLGKSYYFQAKYQRARIRLLEIKNSDLQSKLIPEVDLWLSKISIAFQDYEIAENNLERLMNQKVNRDIKGEAQYYLGTLYQNQKEYQKAINAFEQSYDDFKRMRPQILFSIAAIYDTLDNYQKSKEYFNKVIRLNPNEDLLYRTRFRKIKIEKQSGNLETAIRLFDNLLGEVNKKNQEADINLELASTLRLQGKEDEAIIVYHDLIADQPSTIQAAEAHYILGDYYELSKNNYQKALDHFIEVRKSSSKSIYADTAEVKKRDIQRYFALKQVIKMALEGEEGDVVEIEDEFQTENSDSTYVIPIDSTQVNLIEAGQNTDGENLPANTIPPHMRRQEGLNDQQNSSGQNKPNAKPVENPELKTFKKEEIDKNLFLLAELFLFRFNYPDSSILQYNYIVNNFPESPYAPKAFYNLGFIMENVNGNLDSATVFYRSIIEKYPLSTYANHARSKLGLPVVQSREDSLTALILEAESDLFNSDQPEKAISIYSHIIENYPESKLAPKATYLLGWAYESKLDSFDLAYTVYDSLAQRYPNSIYARPAQKKVNAVQKSQRESQAKSKADSLQAISPADSTIQLADAVLLDTLKTDEKIIKPDEKRGRVKDLENRNMIKKRIDRREEEKNLAKPVTTADKEQVKRVLPDEITSVIEGVQDTLSEEIQQDNNQEIEKAKLIGGVKSIQDNIKYPTKEIKKRYKGIAILQIQVNEKGIPIKMELLEKEEETLLYNILWEAVQKVTFVPASQHGKSVISWITINIELNS